MDYSSPYCKYYRKIYTWFQRNPAVLRIFIFFYHILPIFAVLMYGDLLVMAMMYGGKMMILKVIFVPLILFIGITLLRKVINAPRPYTKYEITPLIQKDKENESMPSRHTASFTIIAMAWLYVYVPVGCIMLFLALLMGVLRVIAGVHFIKDVVTAYGISVIVGIIGFFIL